MLWDAIFKTVRVTEDNDPVKEWDKHNKNLRDRYTKLNNMKLRKLHYTSSNGTDLTVGLIPGAMWMGGEDLTQSGIPYNPNMPSEEIFTTPMKGQAEGIVYATKPLSYNGQLIDDFCVTFKDGKAVAVKAGKGQKVLEDMIVSDETSGYLGECALIPNDSPINNTGILFYETLFDENASCHLALGHGFREAIPDNGKYSNEEIKEMGVNDSLIHVDFMIGAPDMCITGYDEKGKAYKIFENGEWAF